MRIRILLACGGTGGHVYPAIALADAFKKHYIDIDILFVGTPQGLEMEVVPAAGYRIEAICSKGIQRRHILKNVALPIVCLRGLWQARKILKTFKPNLVIGMGGYACFPTLVAAYMQDIPVLVHEQNSIAGLSNSILALIADKICTGYSNVKWLGKSHKATFTGNPVREFIRDGLILKAEALQYFKFSSCKKCLLVMGGSGGAYQLNRIIGQHLDDLEKFGIQLIWITGKRYMQQAQNVLAHYKGNLVRCYPYLVDMHRAYAAADVVVSRAGALAIAELAVAKKPMILVPSPNVVQDHQTKNSLPLVAKGAAIGIADQDCSKVLISQVVDLLFDQAKQANLIAHMQEFSVVHAQACQKIIKVTEALVKA